MLDDAPNPYEFANPVTEPERFAGRSGELEDIRYYLELAGRTARPVSLAVIGDRASGKTSLLNIIELEANQAGLLTARINLNSADSDPINFFWKVYDSVVEAACDAGYLFKPGSDEDIIYQKILYGHDPSADQPNFPLRFPSHYVVSVSGGRQIAEGKLQKDLAYIHSQTGKAFVLLVDECNVLAQNRITLEMLRNIFMNVPGYLIVLTGTPELFPLLDDVFSPITRQFKKISITPFSDVNETSDCVVNPLKSISVDPEEVIPQRYLLTREIHAISQGRPYEIQLLCHIMFRRVQERRAKEMNLTADVIDDVLIELEKSISYSPNHPIVTTVRTLSKKQLAAVGVFGKCSGSADFDHACFIHALRTGTPAHDRKLLEGDLAQLVARGIFVVGEEGKIKFQGDDFDRIYTRYHAERFQVSASIDGLSTAVGLGSALAATLRINGQNPLRDGPGGLPLNQAVEQFLPFSGDVIPESSYRVYRLIWEALDAGKLVLGRIKVSYKEEAAHCWLTLEQDLTDMTQSSWYSEMRNVVESNGGTLSEEEFTFDLPNEDDLFEYVQQTGNDRLLSQFTSQPVNAAVASYTNGERERALKDVARSLKFKLPPDQLNSMAYIDFAVGERSASSALFWAAYQAACEKGNFEIAALARYNCGICELAVGRRDEAIVHLRAAASEQTGHPGETYELACLFVPVVDQSNFKIREIWRPELFASINEALLLLESDGSLLEDVQVELTPNPDDVI